MADNVTPEKRAKIMRSIISKSTKPELVLRRFLFSKGYRYRKNYNKLPGRPDIVFISKKIAIFVHGCFWHQHKNCEITNIPQSITQLWKEKFTRNKDRDKLNQAKLKEMGWTPIVIWECEILDKNRKVRNMEPILMKINFSPKV